MPGNSLQVGLGEQGLQGNGVRDPWQATQLVLQLVKLIEIRADNPVKKFLVRGGVSEIPRFGVIPEAPRPPEIDGIIQAKPDGDEE
jgi:hypothetical protein